MSRQNVITSLEEVSFGLSFVIVSSACSVTSGTWSSCGLLIDRTTNTDTESAEALFC